MKKKDLGDLKIFQITIYPNGCILSFLKYDRLNFV